MKRAILVPLLLLAALPSLVRADVDLTIGNGDTILGTLSPGTEQETFRFRAPTLAVLNVVAKGKKQKGAAQAPAVRFKILDSTGFEVASSQHLTTPTGDRLKNVELNGTGEFRAVVSSSNGVAGDYQLQIKWKTRTPLVYDTGNLDAGVTNFEFGADAGSVPTFSITFPKGSPVRPWLQKFTDFGSYEQTFPQPPAGTKKLKIKGAAVPATANYGAFTTDVGGAGGGPFKATITLKVPKPSTRKITLTDRVFPGAGDGATVRGAIVGGAGGVVPVGTSGGTPIDGASVTIPPGALTAPTAIVIGTGTPIPGSGVSATGPTVVFGPGGQHFKTAVTITLPFDPALLAGGDPSSIQVYTRDEHGNVTLVTGTLTVDAVAGTISFSSSHFSAYRAFGPKRKPSADLNGDGIDDLVIPAPTDSTDRGAVFVFFGRAGIDTLGSAKASDADVVLSGKNSTVGPVSGDFFGAAVATGDVNGDGVADLVVGATRVGGSGAVYAFFGGTGFASRTSGQADAVLSPNQSDLRFGAAIVVADVNGDDQPDVLVGAPLSNQFLSDGGAVYRFLGGVGFTSAAASSQTVFAYTPESKTDHFGAAIAVGDLENDGKPDVAIGADQLTSQGNGKVYVYLSSKSYASPAQAGTNTADFTGTATDDRFGASVAIGDVNQDGIGDLVVGAPNADDEVNPNLTDIGLVYVFHGHASFNGLPASQRDRRIGSFTPAVGNGMGESVAVANVLGNSAADILATAPGGDDSGLTDSGQIYLVLGGTKYPTLFHSTQGDNLGDRLGVLLVRGDVNGDGFLDVVVALPHANSDSGVVRVYFGPAGLTGRRLDVTGNAGQALGRRDVQSDGSF